MVVGGESGVAMLASRFPWPRGLCLKSLVHHPWRLLYVVWFSGCPYKIIDVNGAGRFHHQSETDFFKAAEHHDQAGFFIG